MSAVHVPSPPAITAIAQRLADAGFEAVLVGGCVRDSLLGRIAKDWDLATNARPDEVSSLFAGATVTTRFGTTLVPTPGEVVEVTTYRTEHGYSDFRRPDKVHYTGSLNEDLARRDFTINALAYDPVARILHDPFAGREDLARRSLRAVGRADDRFGEDALRLLRAVRFVGQLGFSIEPDTARAIERHSHLVSELAVERVGIELGKLLVSPHAAQAMVQMEKLKLWRSVLREMGGDFEHAHVIRVAGNMPATLAGRLAALLHHADPTEASARMVKLGFGADTTSQARRLIEIASLVLPADDRIATSARMIRRWDQTSLREGLALRAICANDIGDRSRSSEQLLLRAEAVYRAGMPLRIADLEIGGHELMRQLNLREGPQLGQLLKQLLEDVTDGLITNRRPELLARARTIMQKETR